MRPWLVWLGPLYDPSGYSDEARGFLRALEGAGAAPVAVPTVGLDSDAGLTANDAAMLDLQSHRRAHAPAVVVHHYLPGPGQPSPGGAVNVARVMFESDSVPAGWVPLLNQRDEVWVPTQFNVGTFAAAGVAEDKLRVLNGTLDFDLFTESAEPLDLGVANDAFVFVTNFDFSERKGWRQLIRAWARAFDATDPVCLVLKTGSYWQDDAEVRERIERFVRDEVGGTERLALIQILTGTLTSTELPRFYAAADAYVLASRGEGWGRPYMEAMAMGLPTIASRWSGNLEFMNDGNSFLVDGEVVPVPGDAELINDLYRGHRWFEPDVDALADAMRAVAGDPGAARKVAAGARAELIAKLGPEATAARIGELADAAVSAAGSRVGRVSRGEARGNCDIESARTVAVLAFADELVEQPELLRAYGERFGPDDDVTLVIYSPGADPGVLEPKLLAAAAAAGLDGEATADVLAMPLGRRVEDDRLLAASVDAALSERTPEWAFGALPRFGDSDVDGLRRYAQRVRSRTFPACRIDGLTGNTPSVEAA
jgi:glycosyltransferase involved in cell wall biosynthesis